MAKIKCFTTEKIKESITLPARWPSCEVKWIDRAQMKRSGEPLQPKINCVISLKCCGLLLNHPPPVFINRTCIVK